MSIFSVGTWSLLGLVYLLAGVTLWLIANVRTEIVPKETVGFKRILLCFYSAWAVLLSVSVPEMPRSRYVRLVFIFYVGYSFAISLVFQAFFTTFLVEPGYGRGFQTYPELTEAHIVFGEIDIVQIILDPEYRDLISTQYVVNCGELTKCVLRAMFQKDMMTLTGANFPHYLALKHGVHDVSKVVCFFPDVVFNAQLGIAMHKGEPLLPMLNKYMRKCIEAGILTKYWSELKHTYRWEGFNKLSEDKLYFVFKLQHLWPVFILLFCGYVICFIVFNLEICMGMFRKFFRKMKK
ncbi:hypothetical protein L9F63_013680 [Diploptera punctata]|uniref:Ionotropic glutamate receptor C-terminal domain-containing protein n=1 Tax=Diploptera punctata TaxID=6984 RepID=A0AAD8A9M9_DIPPU|nr:hypothetical protein L9F63_013680 [Diploptera punctata]